MIRFVSFVAMVFLSGCASVVNVTYFSDPPGAAIYSKGERKGYAPQTITYRLSEDDKKNGYAYLTPLKAQWASGATAEAPRLRVDLKTGLRKNYTFKRPNGIPGLDIDTRFSLELDRTRAIQRQAEAQEERAGSSTRDVGVACFKQREWSSGFNKNCVYNCLGSEAVQTIGVTDLCPLTITR